MNCYACNQEMKSVFPFEDSNQFENALLVTFNGGYGMFIDNFEIESYYEKIICHECAHELCDKIPWIKELLNPYNSHSHKVEYYQNNPDHSGWDNV